MLIASNAYATAQISFVDPTPADGAIIEDTSVEIKASIFEESGYALTDVTFNWNGTDYTLYDVSLVLMFNFDNIAALGEDYTADGLVKDISGAGNDGYLYSSPGVPEWIPDGKYGGAFDFTGNGVDSGQSILVYHSDSLNPGSGDFAIVLWILTKDDYDGDILRKGSTYTASMWYKVEHAPGGDTDTISLNFNTDGTDATINSTDAYNDYQWHFVVAQRRGDYAELWIDGVNDGIAFVSGNIWNEANLAIGSKDTQDDDFINSTLDEVRIYMRSFSEDEIQELYYSNLSKYDIDKWTLYVNQSNLTSGTYTYQAFASDAGATNSTEQRTLTVETPYVPLKGPYLQRVTPESIVIMWETETASDSRVDYWTETDAYYVEDTTLVTIHEMQLTGLAPDTTYYYTVTSEGQTTAINTFATAPAAERSFRFVVYGDTRSQPDEHAAVIDGIINSGPELVLHTGDIVANGRNYDDWGPQFFDPAYNLMINTLVLPILGNHEYNGTGQLWFFDFFSLPGNEQWYAFTYGGVRFIGLNTMADYSAGSAQYNWLETELQSSEYISATWHIVYLHHPPYTASSGHSDDTNVQTHLVPLFEQYGVDMVFGGHTHAYERYFNNGVYYIVTGGGGAPLHSLVEDTQEPIREVGESVYHHCVIDVNVPDASLTLEARRNDGTVIDTITITKIGKATNPNPPDGATAVDVEANLSWTAGVDAVSHDVYFGTTDPPPFIRNQTQTTYDPGTLESSTTYYWAIDEIDSLGGITYGDVWSFTTAPLPGQASNPNPADGATNVSIDADLNWTAGSDTTSHDVYFGTDPLNLPLVSEGQSTTTFDPGTLLYETPYYWRIDEIGPGGVTEGTVWYFTTEALEPVDDVANGENTVSGTVTSGDYTDTQSSNNIYEAIEEKESGGKPDRRYSYLQHKWTFNITGGNIVTFYVEAYHTSNSEGDDFVFAYSIDDLTYTDMLTVTKTSDDNAYQTYALPGSLSGTVYIRVKDTDQTRGNRTLDTIYVDHMYIRSEVSSNPPGQASNPDPPDLAMDVSINAELSWMAGYGATSHDVYFGTSYDAVAGADLSSPEYMGNQTGTTFNPGTLANDTTYYWRIDELNSYGTTTGDVWSFTTRPGTGVGEVYVDNIAMSYKQGGPNYSALATVWIKDDAGADREGATVHGEWSGAVSGTVSGVTGPDGKVTLKSPKKKGGGTFTFTVTDVVASGYMYNAALNVETSDSITIP